MRVVSNTSPISNLAIIDRLPLLRDRYGTVAIPPAVCAELQVLTHPAGKEAIECALREGWIIVETLPEHVAGSTHDSSLDRGEAEAVALAAATGADVLLLDERRGRMVARRLGIAVGGVLGELLHAKSAGRISAVRAEMERLKRDARFFIDARIEAFILSQAGE